MKKKALPIHVYRHVSFDGKKETKLSDRYDKLLLLCDEGFVTVDMDEPPENLVIIESVKVGSCNHNFIRPYAEPKAAGWSAGGNIGFTSDSRFGHEYPLEIHDLDEPWDVYDAISNS